MLAGSSSALPLSRGHRFHLRLDGWVRPATGPPPRVSDIADQLVQGRKRIPFEAVIP